MTRGIYCYLDKENDKIVYVGKDSNIDKNKRHRGHLVPSNYNAQPINRILQNSPDRYIYQVLWGIGDCTDSHLNQMEIFYIKKYNPRFNFTEGGDGISGFKHSEETRKKISENNARYWQGKTLSEKTRKKMSESRKGKKLSEETRKKMSESRKGENNPMYGKTFSEETRKKMSKSRKGENNPMYGKRHSEETRKKMSEALKGKTHSEETRKKMSESKKGKTRSEETRKKISKTQNTTGFYRVSKQKNSSCKQGFIWCYHYPYKLTRKSISSTDLKKLEKKVKKEGLEWKIIDKENSIKSIQENNNRFN